MSRIARPQAMTSRELEKQILSVYGGGSTSTGIHVNTDSAMRAMSVHTCVKAKSNGIRMMDCYLMKREGGKKREATEHPVFNLLYRRPNSWMTPSDFWGMVSACLDLRGNFYALKSGLSGRQVKELIPLPVGAVQEVIQTPDYGLFYKVVRPTQDVSGNWTAAGQGVGGQVDTIPASRIMHIRGLTLDGFTGLNPIAYARESIGLELAEEKHGAKLFSNGTNIGGVLTMPPGQFFKDRVAAKNFLDSFNENYSSVENAHKAALLENGVTWTKMGMTSVDSQFLEARHFQHKQIVDLFFTIPLSIMSTGDKTATFASAEQFSIAYVMYALMPYVKSIEQAINRDLLLDTEGDYFAKFDAKELQRGSFREQMEGFQIAVNTEILNPNECRDVLDYNPYEGGDEYRTRTSSMKKTGEKENEPKKTPTN
jgi:HK97 family phage portal protein